MPNWETFKSVLQGDLEAWNHFVSQLATAYENEKDILLRKEIQATLLPLTVYQEVTNHYLEVMEQIESGTYEVKDGGSEES
jgi:hypothetical protein